MAIALFSASFVLGAAALWAIVQVASPGRMTTRFGLVAAVGSALAGSANELEDGFGQPAWAYPFFAGILMLSAASVGFAIGLATTRRGFRLAATATLFAAAPFALGDAGPGKVVAGAIWLAMGLRGQQTWSTPSRSAD